MTMKITQVWQNLTNNTNASNKTNVRTANSVYRWRKPDNIMAGRTFRESVSEPSEEYLTPLQYFKLFLEDEISNTLAERTDLYSVQKFETSVNTN